MLNRTLIYTAWRYLIRHPWQSILMVLGIALGVAVVVAVDLANTSASRAFDLSTQSVAGKATHQIVGGPGGLDESVYTDLRRSGFPAPSAPVLSAYVAAPQLGDIPLQLLGVDPFAETPFRDYLGDSAAGLERSASENLAAFLTRPGAILIAADLADRYDLTACPDASTTTPSCQIDMTIAGETRTATIVGLLRPADRLSRRALNGLILSDIATAQEFSGQIGKLGRIDLILPEDEPQQIAEIRALLPPDAQLQPVAARGGAVEQMTAAFRLNLTALSLLALVVGMFLIYNTITFSVVQRRPFFGTLRCLGVTRREVFTLVLAEAAFIGALGTVFGLVIGILMGQGAVQMVTRTINDLFFVVTVRGVQIPPASLVKGALLGMTATFLSAAPPAREAAAVLPRQALSRSGLERKAQQASHLAAAFGVILILLGALLLGLPSRSLVVSFAGTFAVVVGFAMLAPLATGLLMRSAAPLSGQMWGVLGRMAPRNVVKSLSRTAIAVMALMVAVSVTIGVSLMVSSFRHTVVTWLAETLQGDVYISAPSLTATSPSTPLQAEALETARNWPGVARMDVLRSVVVDSPLGSVQIAASDNRDIGTERVYLAIDIPPEQVWSALQDGAVLVSEPFANRVDLPRHNGQIVLNTVQGERSFPVVGIYYDYSATQGTVLMARSVYQALWEDPLISAALLRLEPGVDPDQTANRLQAALAPTQTLLVRPNQALRQDVLAVFDRTFAITGALQLLATVVAFIGVLSALLSLELERQRELGILRSVGLTVRQLFGLISLETGLIGAAAGVLALPTGYVLALILVYIINKRSFGWTLQMQLDWAPFAQALAVAVLAALLAGLYPALRIGRMTTSEALRAE